MAEGGYDELDPLSNQEEYTQYSVDDDADNMALQNLGRPIGTGEDEVYEAETSFGDTGLTATKTQFRDSVVDDFYKQLGYEPFGKYYNNCVLEKGNLY